MDTFLNRSFKIAVLVLLGYIGVQMSSTHVVTNELKSEVNHLNMKVEDLSKQVDTLKVQMEQLKETHPYIKK